MAKQKGTMTVLQFDIVELWVQGLSAKDISAQLNCSVETVRAVKKNEEYKKMYYDRQREQVIDLIPLAIKRLKNLLGDDDVQASVAIAAIKETLDRANLGALMDNSDKDIKIVVSYE
jgi:uncharacterized protein YjcR